MKIFLFLILFFNCKVVLIAQTTTAELTIDNYETKAKNAAAVMNNMLSLSTAQFDSVKIIMNDFYYQMALSKPPQYNTAERGQRYSALHDDLQRKLRVVLKREQYVLYITNKEHERIRAVKITDSLAKVHRRHNVRDSAYKGKAF